ncbi:hypothetical protein [Marilutibacter aestuarii]|uniref:Uncharacterized protein n=1 Tax=Marilutibacter aestuarii TaxID=1706195 RepID=A0A507ZU36_9GAMM|nr:hypothetical protein [Lysobacter aestuarii]TQD39258.1 hypothetical protein FKV25_15665 [Lysobacter aestuarii]
MIGPAGGRLFCVVAALWVLATLAACTHTPTPQMRDPIHLPAKAEPPFQMLDEADPRYPSATAAPPGMALLHMQLARRFPELLSNRVALTLVSNAPILAADATYQRLVVELRDTAAASAAGPCRQTLHVWLDPSGAPVDTYPVASDCPAR